MYNLLIWKVWQWPDSVTCFRNNHTEVNLQGWYIGVGWPYICTVYKACTLFWFCCPKKFIPVSPAYNELETKFFQYLDLCLVCFQILFCIFMISSFGEIYIFRKGDIASNNCCHLIQGMSSCGEDLNLVQFKHRSWDNIVGIATNHGLDDQGVGVRVPLGSRIFSSPCHPDQLWCQPNLLCNG
jgi:hypothetical protein